MSFIYRHGNSFVCRLLFFQLFIFLASPCLAEELEPRRWAHLPIDTNFTGTAYELAWGGDLDMDIERSALAGRVSGTYEDTAVHFVSLNAEWRF